MSAEPIGRWKRPPCYYCRTPIEATAGLEHAPVWLKEVFWWAHWSCLRAAVAMPLPDPGCVKRVPRQSELL